MGNMTLGSANQEQRMNTPKAEPGEMNLTVDGVKLPGKAIPLIDEHREHSVEVRIPASRTDALNTQQAGFLDNDPVHGGDFVFGLFNHRRHRPRHADQPLNDTGGRTHGNFLPLICCIFWAVPGIFSGSSHFHRLLCFLSSQSSCQVSNSQRYLPISLIF
jgi:hypothetical protein